MDYNATNSRLIVLDAEILTRKMNLEFEGANATNNAEIRLIDELHESIQRCRKAIHLHLGLPTE